MKNLLRTVCALFLCFLAVPVLGAEDIRAREREELDARAARELESQNALTETRQAQAEKGVELLSAMLERYKPEDFLIYRLAGKPEPVKDKTDVFQVPIEVTFNEKLYYEAFVPDLEKVLDQIAARKKNVLLLKQKDELRKLKNGEAIDSAQESVILRGADLGGDYSLAVYDKPDRFGCRVYGFAQENIDAISDTLAQFLDRIYRVSGFQLELQDEEKEPIYTVDQDATLFFLLSNSEAKDNVWAFHPTILNAPKESARITIPLDFEMPVELQEVVKSLKVALLLQNALDALARLGIRINNADSEVANRFNLGEGAIKITRVIPGSIADRVGIMVGDHINTFNGRRFNGPTDFINKIRSLNVDTIEISVLRGNEWLTVKVKLSGLPR